MFMFQKPIATLVVVLIAVWRTVDCQDLLDETTTAIGEQTLPTDAIGEETLPTEATTIGDSSGLETIPTLAPETTAVDGGLGGGDEIPTESGGGLGGDSETPAPPDLTGSYFGKCKVRADCPQECLCLPHFRGLLKCVRWRNNAVTCPSNSDIKPS